MITALDIKNLRERTGAGMQECQRALEKCDGNEDLAFYFLRYDGCAINVANYDEWVMQRARQAYEEDKSKASN